MTQLYSRSHAAGTQKTPIFGYFFLFSRQICKITLLKIIFIITLALQSYLLVQGKVAPINTFPLIQSEKCSFVQKVLFLFLGSGHLG